MPLRLCLPLCLLCRPCHTSWTKKDWFSLFFFRSVSLLSSSFFLSCLPSGLVVSSFCWSITWAYRKTDRTSKHRLRPLGTRLRPERMHDGCLFCFFFSFFCFHILSVSFIFCPFFALRCSIVLLPSSFSGVLMYHGYVLGVISLQMIRDGMPQVAIAPLPLRTGTAVHVLSSLYHSIETFIIACFVITA